MTLVYLSRLLGRTRAGLASLFDLDEGAPPPPHAAAYRLSPSAYDAQVSEII